MEHSFFKIVVFHFCPGYYCTNNSTILSSEDSLSLLRPKVKNCVNVALSNHEDFLSLLRPKAKHCVNVALSNHYIFMTPSMA